MFSIATDLDYMLIRPTASFHFIQRPLLRAAEAAGSRYARTGIMLRRRLSQFMGVKTTTLGISAFDPRKTRSTMRAS